MKEPWKLVLWLILLNKPKVLAGLFKTTKGGLKFEKFFN